MVNWIQTAMRLVLKKGVGQSRKDFFNIYPMGPNGIICEAILNSANSLQVKQVVIVDRCFSKYMRAQLQPNILRQLNLVGGDSALIICLMLSGNLSINVRR